MELPPADWPMTVMLDCQRNGRRNLRVFVAVEKDDVVARPIQGCPLIPESGIWNPPCSFQHRGCEKPEGTKLQSINFPQVCDR